MSNLHSKLLSKCYMYITLKVIQYNVMYHYKVTVYSTDFCTCTCISDGAKCTPAEVKLTDTAMLISELTRFDSFYIFFHGTPRVVTM